MKKIALVAAAVFLAASLTGCNKKPAAAAGKHEKVTIKFPTAGASGALYAVGAAITNLWDTEIDFVSASSQASNGGIATRVLTVQTALRGLLIKNFA